MVELFKNFIIALLFFLIFDVIWLFCMKSIYQNSIGYLIGQFKLVPAILFYVIFILGLLYFAIIPGMHDNSIIKTVINSAILGLVCYATYDLTNLSTLKGWPFYITVIDIFWGTFLSALIGFLTYTTTRLL